MFEIGASLRDARLRQGLELADVERGTKIRGKYLRAIEDEHFEALPSETYVKGFLRTYAEFLGLDGQPFVDEYASRYLVHELPERVRGPRRSDAARPTRRAQTTLLVAGLGLIALVTALVIAAWRFGTSGSTPSRPVTPTPAPHRTARAKAPAPAAAKTAHLSFEAAGGSSWISIRRTSATGAVVYEGTLADGRTRRASGKLLWVSVGQPRNLVVKLNGNRIRLDPHRAPAVLLVTPTGVATG